MWERGAVCVSVDGFAFVYKAFLIEYMYVGAYACMNWITRPYFNLFICIYAYMYVPVCICVERYCVRAFRCSFTCMCFMNLCLAIWHSLSLFTLHHPTDRSLCMKALASDATLTLAVVSVLVLCVCDLLSFSPLHVLVFPALNRPTSAKTVLLKMLLYSFVFKFLARLTSVYSFYTHPHITNSTYCPPAC